MPDLNQKPEARNLTQVNIGALNALKKYFTKKPSRLRMGSWIVTNKSEKIMSRYQVTTIKIKGREYFKFPDRDQYYDPLEQIIPDCGTVCCAAGATYIIKHGIDKYVEDVKNMFGLQTDSIINEAQLTLGLRSTRFFHVPYWPNEFRLAYQTAKNQTQRVKILCKVIDRLIENDGELNPLPSNS